MAGTRAPFASLAALAAVASAQAEQTGTAAAETAKKDLQSLPAVQRPAEATSGKSLFSGSAAGLSLGISDGNAAPAKNKEDGSAGKSANWLLDGVNQLEAEAKAQRDASDDKKRVDNSQESSTGERQNATATANPFAAYMTQWLSPGDQALLNAGSRNASSSSTAPWETPRSDFKREIAPATQAAVTTNPLQMELPGISSFSASQQSRNPYLADPFQVEGGLGASVAGSANGRDAAGSLPPILTPAQAVLPPAAPVSAPVEQAKAAPVAPPTERLIDDRKYFPQLRRF
ncbi:MAG: hypothetical protein QM760_03515 [Nibricoccus sp.]